MAGATRGHECELERPAVTRELGPTRTSSGPTGEEAAPIRHARQLREYLASQIVQAVVLVGFLVALVFFARALLHLFERHGSELNPWYLRLCLGGIVVCFVLFARRLIGRIREIRGVRADLREEDRKLEALRDQYRRRDED